MAQTQRQYDFSPGNKAQSQQVDDELNNLVGAHNTLDTDVQGHKTNAVIDHPDQSVTTAKIKDANVTTVKIADANVTTSKIADSNVTTQKIADLNVTTVKIADNAVTTQKIGDGQISTSKILDGNVTTSKIADSHVITSKIADFNVTTEKLANSSVTTTKIVDQAVTKEKLDPSIKLNVGLDQINDQIGNLLSSISNYTYKSLSDWLNDQEQRQWEYGINVKGRKFGASGSAQTTTGSINAGSNQLTVISPIDFQVGQGIAVMGAKAIGVAEVQTLTITSGATSSGILALVMDHTTYRINVSAGDSANTVASKISALSYYGYTVSVNANVVTFTATFKRQVGIKGFFGNNTGVNGTQATSTLGAKARMLVSSITAINGNVLTLADNAVVSVTSATVYHDDSVALQSAFNLTGCIYIPQGVFRYAKALVIPANTIVTGAGIVSEIRGYMDDTTASNLDINGSSNIEIRNLKIKCSASTGINPSGGASKILIEKVMFETDRDLPEGLFELCVHPYDASFITVSKCYFYNVGYQVFQQAGFVSNDCKVIDCISENCYGDFVELNSDLEAPSRNWTISRNQVKNVGMFKSDGSPVSDVQLETRFLGVTMCDNLIVTENMVEGVAGDSAMHIERPSRGTISKNTFKDCHSANGRFAQIFPGIASSGNNEPTYGALNAADFTITENVFIVTDSKFPSDAEVFVDLEMTANYSWLNIRNNIFAYYEPTNVDPITHAWTGYPKEPSTRYGTGFKKSYAFRPATIEGNYFLYLNTGIDISQSYEYGTNLGRGSTIQKNTFYKCNLGINTGKNEWLQSVENNTFESCANAFSLNNMPKRMGNNNFISTPVSGLNAYNSNYYHNIYTGTINTDDAFYPKVFNANTNWNMICKLPHRMVGHLYVWVEQVGNEDVNNTRAIYFLHKEWADSAVTNINTYTKGTMPSFSIVFNTDSNGDSAGDLAINLNTGGTGQYRVFVRIQGFDRAYSDMIMGYQS